MDCKIIKYWISLYIDNELDDEKKIILLEHLNKCPECENYFNQCINIDKNIENLFEEKNSGEDQLKSNIMKKIKEENVKVKKKRKIRSKSAVAAACIIILLFIPINGKSVAALINEWTKNLIVQNDKLVIEVETGVDFSEEDDIKDKYITKKESEKKEEPKELSFYNKETFIEKMNEINDYPHMSSYVTEGYRFMKGKIYEKERYGGKEYSFETKYEKFNVQNESCGDELIIKISYMPENTKLTKVIHKVSKFTEGEVEGVPEIIVKEAKISEEIGYFERFSLDTTLYMVISNYPVKLEIVYYGYEDEKIVEEELTKIAENLIEEIKKKVPECK